MPGRTVSALYVQKLVYIFLIIWVGGLAPLIFFENYSSHRGVQRVRVSLLNESGMGKLPAALLQLRAQGIYRQSRGSNDQPQLVTRNVSLPGINASVTFFHDGYLLSTAQSANYFDTLPAGRVLEIQLMGRSVWLSPPEKPPPFPASLM